MFFSPPGMPGFPLGPRGPGGQFLALASHAKSLLLNKWTGDLSIWGKRKVNQTSAETSLFAK